LTRFAMARREMLDVGCFHAFVNTFFLQIYFSVKDGLR
jgi:hypothetical protein